MAVLARVRVLVVDDEEDARFLLTLILESQGAEVKACGSAEEALGAVTDWKPDVIVSDLCMPEYDGYWLVESVRSLDSQNGGRTPVIAVTACTSPEERKKAARCGFQVYLTKPLETEKLISAVRQLVSE